MIDGNTLKNNVKFYVENFLYIRTKTGTTELLKMKPAQQKLYETIEKLKAEGKPIRIVILKARQLGFSTLIEALYFQQSATHKNIRTMIVAHDDDATTNLFRLNKRYYDNLPDWLKPDRTASNSREIIFDNKTEGVEGLGSTIRCVPATGSSVGRSDTLTNVHCSEVAFWRDMGETLTALLQAVPNESNTSVILETTPNGYNAFKTLWDDAIAGKNGFLPIFYPWFDEPGYRMKCDGAEEWDEEEKRLKKTYKLDNEQLKWRRWCIATNLAGDKEKFLQEYPSCPEEAFLTSGNPYFDNATILSRIRLLEHHFVRGRYIYGETENGCPVDIEWQEDPHGEIWKYEEPLERHPYVAGADTSGDGSDRFTAYLLDNSTGYQVAQLFYDGNSELYFTQQLYCLGKEYNEALLGVEINFSSYPEKKLEEWKYRKLYIREKPDDMRGQLSTYKWGWRTDMRTRPLILANLQTLIKQNSELIMSEELLRECLVFIRNEQMRPEAAEGSHDDLVICAAIANYIRPQQRYEVEEEPVEARKKLIDDPRFAKERKRLRR